ncbi:MAG: hypothetical protein LBR73_07455 [Oscillospiraceae bacterium]|jgi:hypothetical protein|nr:hypothetical protein [Oscillospiraceae bacterium]
MTEEALRLLEEIRREVEAEEREARRARRRNRSNAPPNGAVFPKRSKAPALLLAVALAAAAAVPAFAAQTVPNLHLLGQWAAAGDTVINKDILDAIYPVGKIYMSTQNLNPATQFGGTWAALGAGQVLVAEGTGFTAGTTGGSTDGTAAVSLSGNVTGVGGSVNLTGTVTGVGAGATLSGTASVSGGTLSTTSGNVTLVAANMPQHTHGISHTHTANHQHHYYYAYERNGNPKNGGNTGHSYWKGSITRRTSTWSGVSGTYSGSSESTGSATPFTFNSSGTVASSSPLTGSASAKVASTGWSGTAAYTGTVSGLSGTASASGNVTDKTMQPYLVVYMWQRTA